jgi:hypothetical protein
LIKRSDEGEVSDSFAGRGGAEPQLKRSEERGGSVGLLPVEGALSPSD